jgi:predicted small metal-binding protein
MLKFACKDLGIDCTFVATGATVEEVKQKAMTHAQSVHKDLLSKMTPKQLAELPQNIISKIR